MKLIWHLIKNDIRRDRWALLLWAALFVAQIGLGLALLQDPGDSRGWIEKMETANGFVVLVGFVAGYVLVARLVLADPLLGTDMFWATRPIPRSRLLLAKAGAALLLFAVLPVVLLTPWWLWCGFTGRDLFWSAVDTFGWQLLMIAPAFLLASLTNEIGRVLLWSLLLFIAGLLCVALLASLFTASRDLSEPGILLMSSIYTRTWLAVVLGVLFSAGIAAHQYLTQRLNRSIGLTAVGILVVVATGLFAPLDWGRGFSELPLPANSPEIAAAVDAMKVEAGAAMPSNRPGMETRRNVQEPSIVTEIYFQGLPGNLSVSSGLSRQTWRWPDGLRVSRVSYSGTGFLPSERLLRETYALVKPEPDPETEAHFKAEREAWAARRQTRGDQLSVSWRIVEPSRPGARNLVHSTVPPALIKRAQAEPPAYEASLRGALTRAAVFAELPLRPGARGEMGSARARLMWIGPPPAQEDTSASILVTAPRLQQTGLWLVNVLARDWLSTGSRGEVWAMNRTTGDLLRCGGYALQSTRSALVAGVAFSWNQPRVNAATLIRSGKPVPRDPQWRDHTTLVLVTEEVAARFTANVQTDRLEFRSSLWVEQVKGFTAEKN
jgi:hypothetical protein